MRNDDLTERGGGLPQLDDLVDIARQLAAADLAELELTSPIGARIKLRVDVGNIGGGPRAPTPPPETAFGIAVRSPYFGRLELSPNFQADEALVSAEAVEEGDIIGTIVIGVLSLPILSTVRGRVATVSKKHGRLIGYGEIVATVEPRDVEAG